MDSYMIILSLLAIAGWSAVALIGTQAYFLGEQRKPIHDRNWKSESFRRLAKAFTARNTDEGDRVPALAMDSFYSANLPKR